MRSRPQSSSPSTPPPSGPAPRVFYPEFLARLREVDGPLTAAEAEYAGPWRMEPVPGGPGEVAVVRAWESLAEGDVPRGVFRQEDVARLWAVALPLAGREPLFHLGEQEEERGYPVTAVEGEQGTQVCGWLSLFEPQVVDVVHVLQGLLRSPVALAALLETAGSEALAQVDRILGGRLGA